MSISTAMASVPVQSIPPTAALPAPLAAEALKELVLNALADLKAKEIVCLNVRELTSVCDYMVLCTGSSNRHAKAIADRVVQNAKAAHTPPLGVEGEQGAEWILIDLGDVLVHVMTREARDYYCLEKLWDSQWGLPGGSKLQITD